MMNDQSVLQGIPDNVTISDLSKYIVRTNRNYDLRFRHTVTRSVLPENHISYIRFQSPGFWYLWEWTPNVSVPDCCMML